MPVEVTPREFSLVEFTADRIAALAADVAAAAGFQPTDVIQIDVNETTPLTQVRIIATDPVRLYVESGAFDDPHMPRVLGDGAVRTSLAIPLFRAFDRRLPEFAGAPPESDLDQEHRAAWDVAVAGRISRAGLPSPRQRRLYAFRVRHGFTDLVDDIFDRLWTKTDVVWSDIERACQETAEARASV
jgi:hypothetical protein